MKKIVKIPVIIILILIILAVAIRLILPLAAVEIANRKLPAILNTKVSIGSLRLGLLRGYVSISDLRIAQPEGFGEGDLLLVPEVSLKVKLSSLFSPPLTVEKVVLTDWEVNLVKNRDGVMNLDAIRPKSPPRPSPSSLPESKEHPEKEEESTSKPILVQTFAIKNLLFSYTDYAIGIKQDIVTEAEVKESASLTEVPKEEKVLRVKIAALDLLLNNLLIDPAADPKAIEPASAVLTARIIQEPFSDGLLGLAARIGPVGSGLPPLNSVLRLADLELEPIDVVVPAGVAQVLGGSALDLSADLALASYLLDCKIEVEASGGHRLPLVIGGTPDKPEIDTSSLLFGVMLHLGGGVESLAGNIAGTGYQVGATVAETTWAAGKGTANVVGSIGGGLFKTITSAATGNLDGVVEGLSDTTVGTAEKAAAAGGDVVGEVAKGATATTDSMIGEDADHQWRADTPRRWEESWSEAQKLLAGMPFPPPARVRRNSGR